MRTPLTAVGGCLGISLLTRGGQDVVVLDELSRVEGARLERRVAGDRFELDDGGHGVFCIASGCVMASILDADGDVVLATLSTSGEFIGLERLVGVSPPYELLAVVPTEVCVLPSKALRAWANATQARQAALMDRALAAMHHGIEQRVQNHGTALVRTARFLASIVKKGCLDPAVLPKHVIANLLDMRPETLSRALRELERRGAIEVSPRLTVVHAGTLFAIGT